jgi:hypothetical protein
VNEVVIIELKSFRRIIRDHEVQLVNYLVSKGKPVSLVLNFGERKVEIKGKVKDLNEAINPDEIGIILSDMAELLRR